MLRITTHQDDPLVQLIRLEGRLEGPWVQVLADCWSMLPARPGRSRLYVDLNGMMFIDAAGKAILRQMHQQGAHFIADDLFVKAIVAEITTQENSKCPEHL